MYLPTAEPNEIVAAIKRHEIGPEEIVFILLGEKNKPDIEQLVAQLNQHDIEFVGAMFPALIYDEQKYEEGAIISVWPVVEKPFLVTGLNNDQIEFPDFDEIGSDDNKKYTAMVFVDGLTSNIASFLAQMFNRFGDSVNYFGGGAGSLSLQQEPCVFTPAGAFQDAAVVTFVPLEISLRVKHGWQKLLGPMVATKTHKNKIIELDWRNAFEVYQEVVEADSGTNLTKEDFFNLAKGYPFGIYKDGVEDRVLDPIIATESGELVCLIDVSENVALNMLKGDRAELVRAAGQAADHRQNLAGRQLRHSLIVDCISRVLFLEEDFDKELAEVRQNITLSGCTNVPEGILTLGEISSDGQGVLEFYNKTIVVGMLYE